MKLSEAIKLRELIEKAVESLTDNEAVQAKMLYPKWETLIGKTVDVGFKLQYNGNLHKVEQAHTVQADWTPDTATSLYSVIDEQHDGSLADPIPWKNGMTIVNGLYYIENGYLYQGIRDSGIPIYHALNDLIGSYVVILN